MVCQQLNLGGQEWATWWAGIGPWRAEIDYLLGMNWALVGRNGLLGGRKLVVGGKEWASWLARIEPWWAGMGFFVGWNLTLVGRNGLLGGQELGLGVQK